ncbi:hypothetical protein HAX54_016674 [Datura stramonium]|uniref:Protein kinase domain-containing protein n=1 Tax=Datura stramonium TaxID=4076 RepID=A0ABS8ULJ8_DATST|nr:hypothetical protein [Datura stramonium]
MGLLEVKHGLLQIAETLDFLHSNARLIHRSISPETILITSNGAWKLGGFGFTISVDQAADLSNMQAFHYAVFLKILCAYGTTVIEGPFFFSDNGKRSHVKTLFLANMKKVLLQVISASPIACVLYKRAPYMQQHPEFYRRINSFYGKGIRLPDCVLLALYESSLFTAGSGTRIVEVEGEGFTICWLGEGGCKEEGLEMRRLCCERRGS